MFLKRYIPFSEPTPHHNPSVSLSRSVCFFSSGPTPHHDDDFPRIGRACLSIEELLTALHPLSHLQVTRIEHLARSEMHWIRVWAVHLREQTTLKGDVPLAFATIVAAEALGDAFHASFIQPAPSERFDPHTAHQRGYRLQRELFQHLVTLLKTDQRVEYVQTPWHMNSSETSDAWIWRCQSTLDGTGTAITFRNDHWGFYA